MQSRGNGRGLVPNRPHEMGLLNDTLLKIQRDTPEPYQTKIGAKVFLVNSINRTVSITFPGLRLRWGLCEFIGRQTRSAVGHMLCSPTVGHKVNFEQERLCLVLPKPSSRNYRALSGAWRRSWLVTYCKGNS